MKTIIFIIQKEFKQIFRNKGMLPLLFVLPLLQLVILSNAATFEIKNIKFGFVDHDHSSGSRELIGKFRSSSYFNVINDYPDINSAVEQMELGRVDAILEIPNDFERNLLKSKSNSVSVSINAIDGATAGIENVYISQIIREYNQSIQTKLYRQEQQIIKPVNVLAIPSFWYNSNLNYKTFMVPGILVLLVTMLTLFLSAMNIVREKEIGTLEQINVTPIKKHQFIIGKLFPFWVIGLVVLSIGLFISKVIFNVPMLGNMVLLYLFASVYLLVVLGIGLFISNFTETQQQAMFIAWFFMVIFILMSGLFTPIESMPYWAQKLTLLNPIRYFVEVIRMIMLKGASFLDVRLHLIVITFYAFLINGLAVWSYKKVS